MNAGLAGEAGLWLAIGLGVLAVVTGRRRFLIWSALVALLTTAVLAWALLVSDFSLLYVAETTSLATPWPYRLAALWGGMDGSMVFYATLSLVVAAAALRTAGPIRVGALVGTGLLLVTVFFANPFFVPDIPAVDGEGLLAILQHPAMIYHPPILYTGLVVLVIPFAVTVASSGRGDRDSWRLTVQRWLYVSWTLLTFGMAFGSNWAYVELGWGGFWAWDPVENTALLPWLATTIWLHSSLLERSNGVLRRSNVFLAGLPFTLSVVGVYLTRSGVSGSIHSFAEDPVVGRILLGASVLVAAWLLVVSVRSAAGEPWAGGISRRAKWLLVQVGVMSAILVFVAAGTFYPAFASVFGGGSLTVDSRFYVLTVLPLAVVVAVGISLAHRVGVVAYAVVAGLLLAVSLALVGGEVGLLLGATAGASVLMLVPVLDRRMRIPILAHIGMAVLLVGVGGSALGDDFMGAMRPGDVAEVGGHTVELLSIETGEEDRFIYVRAVFDLDGARLTPEIRAYEDQTVPVAEPALDAGVVDDVIVAISLLFPDEETVAVSVFVRPLMWMVWLGAGLVGLAGLLSLFERAGAGATRRRAATGEQQPGGTTIDSAFP